MNLTDWIGTFGVFLILLAYFLNLFNKISKESYGYIFMNIAGAGMACLASVMINYIPFIVLEAVWGGISVIALFNRIRVSH
jgi:hypothetical protein